MILTLQLAYLAAATAWNVASWLRLRSGRPPLSGTDPRAGLVAMLAYGVALGTALLPTDLVYRLLMVAAVLVFGHGGVWLHLKPEGRARFPSTGAWLLGVGINVCGLVLNGLAALGMAAAAP